MDDSEEHLEPAAHTNDAFFKAVFSDPVHATGFFKKHLPPAVAARIDWASLTVLPGSFVHSSLKQTHSDLLFSVRAGERETLLYLLFEHQTTPDPAMPLRLLGYILEIFRQHHTNHGFPLPPVFPIVLHQGPDPWNTATSFEELFDLPEEIADDLLPWLPKFRHALLDLSRYDPASEEDETRQRVVLQLMKLARQRQLLAYFRWLAGNLAEQLPDSLFTRMLLYALHADGNLDAEGIYHSLSSNPELEKQAMSAAEKLIAQGLERGIEKGLEKGREIGRIQTLQEFLGQPETPREQLAELSIPELQTLHGTLHREYEARFKRS